MNTKTNGSELHPYQDRKKLKWDGFFLSEHTATMAREKKQRDNVILPKEKLTDEEIGSVLSEALVKSKQVAVQLDKVVDDSYLPDIIGPVSGYDEVGIYVGSEVVVYGSLNARNQFVCRKYIVLGKSQIVIEYEKSMYPHRKKV